MLAGAWLQPGAAFANVRRQLMHAVAGPAVMAGDLHAPRSGRCGYTQIGTAQ
jgi:hypothetical protein